MKYDKFYINGEWVSPAGNETLDVINPATEEPCGSVPMGAAADVDAAVAAAKAAFPGWAALSADERAGYLDKIAEIMTRRHGEFADVVCQEMGMPLPMAGAVQVGMPMANFANYARIAREFEYEKAQGGTQIVKEPIGVCGFITPWNYPLHQIVAKVAPALAAGCTMVVKPTEMAPLCAFMLAEVFDEAGVPAGVFNLVNGLGPIVGEAIAAHPDVDMVSFTGSTRAGKRVAELASQTVKRVTQELGGKSANVVLDDADFAKAIPAGVMGCYMNSGQTCSAPTRMLVPRERQEEAVQIAKATAEALKFGDPKGEGTTHGPIVHAAQYEKVKELIGLGVKEGANLVTGGAERPEGVDKGYFVKPTVFSDVTNDMTIAQEEIFGPVLSIIPYDSEEEAVQIANDSIYGLAGCVWSGDKDRAINVARQMRTGQVTINEAGFDINAPFGGYKQSGNGRELGEFGMDEYMEIKALLGYN
jgi:aldehyde dehydrogenase (NAD+)